MVLDLILDWRSLATLVVAYCIVPYTVLWLVVHCWPKGHPRRDELLAEYWPLPMWRRPFWVGDVATHSVIHGTIERIRTRTRTRRRLDISPVIGAVSVVVSSVALSVSTYMNPGAAVYIALFTSGLGLLGVILTVVGLRRSRRRGRVR